MQSAELSSQSRTLLPSEARHLMSGRDATAQTQGPELRSPLIPPITDQLPNQSNDGLTPLNSFYGTCQALLALLACTQQVNHLAKRLFGPNRRCAYEVKGRLLSQAIELDPEDFRVLSFSEGIIGLEAPTGIRFHVPRGDLSPAAKLLLEPQLLQQFTVERKVS